MGGVSQVTVTPQGVQHVGVVGGGQEGAVLPAGKSGRLPGQWFQSSLQGQGGLTLPRRHRAAQRSVEPVPSWLRSVSFSCPTGKSENPLVCSRMEERRIRAKRESALPHWRHPIHPLPFLHIPSAVSGLLELKKEKKEKILSAQAETFRRQGEYERG